MDRMKGQAERLGARIVQEDIVEVRFDRYPFELVVLRWGDREALSVIVATGRHAHDSASPRRRGSRGRASRPARSATGSSSRERRSPW